MAIGQPGVRLSLGPVSCHQASQELMSPPHPKAAFRTAPVTLPLNSPKTTKQPVCPDDLSPGHPPQGLEVHGMASSCQVRRVYPEFPLPRVCPYRYQAANPLKGLFKFPEPPLPPTFIRVWGRIYRQESVGVMEATRCRQLDHPTFMA